MDVGDSFTFDIQGLHPNNGTVKIKSFGWPLLTNDPATFFAPDDFTFAPVDGIFEWQITTEHALLEPSKKKDSIASES